MSPKYLLCVLHLLVAVATDARSHYDILGVPRTASSQEIKKAYRRRAKQLHPDTKRRGITKEQGVHQAVDKEYAALAQAYEVLADASQREAYDGRSQPPQPQFQSQYRCEAPTSSNAFITPSSSPRCQQQL